MRRAFASLACTFAVCLAALGGERRFVHPGITYTQCDLDRMRAMIDAGRVKLLSGRQGDTFDTRRLAAELAAAPDSAIGLECDKFSRSGVDAHFDRFLDPLLSSLAPWCGSTLKYLVQDSWEAGRQDWTDGFEGEFLARRGYDMEPRHFLALTGRVADKNFMDDFDRTKKELFIERFERRFKERAARHGLLLAGEPYGDGDFTMDALAPLFDLPMSEYWARCHYGSIERPQKVDAAAREGARRYVGCEAFTAFPGDADIAPALESFKDDIDLLKTNGVRRFVFHCIAHQPSDASAFTMGPFGTRFDRAHCTAAQLRRITDYIKE